MQESPEDLEFWLWPYGGELPGARPKQKLLEVKRGGARCGVLGLAQRKLSANFAPLEDISPETTISRTENELGSLLARDSGVTPQFGGTAAPPWLSRAHS